jgi:hypothetical protein
MSQFMLLLYDDPSSFVSLSPDDMQRILEEYRSWAGKLGQAGKLVGGEKLKDEGGKVMRQDKGQLKVVDGPYSETKEVVAGYFLIRAENYAQAVELAKDCPHLKYGAKIDVREVDPIQ